MQHTESPAANPRLALAITKYGQTSAMLEEVMVLYGS